MRFKPRYNEYEVRFLSVLMHRDKFSALISEMYQTSLEHMFWLGSTPRNDGEEWLKGILPNEEENNE